MRAPKQQLEVSVIVPLEPGEAPLPNLPALKKMALGKGGGEILVARGWHPSRQRNVAASKARGKWLLFLDSDAVPDPQLVPRLLAAAESFRAQGAGGPNLPPEKAGPPQTWFHWVLSSYFGSGPASARYAPKGKARLSGEKELILCNLLLRRDLFLKAGGFREDLYPNEENELINRLQAQGGRLAYEPLAWVRRPRREDIPAFALQAFRYGRGRMRQVMANFYPGDLVNLAPLAALGWAASLPLYAQSHPRLLLPLAVYLAMDAMAALRVLGASGDGQAALASLLLFPLRHGAYALGLFAGIFSAGESRRDAGKVELSRLRP